MRPSQVHNALVYVAMSGGVDSSVAAALLVRAGARVVGVFMKPWQPPELGAQGCLWRQDRDDALACASWLGIPLETWDVSEEYERRVARPMIEEYRRGRTPNPDIACNRFIKFGLFARRARTEGAQFIATGHYARIVRRLSRSFIARGADGDKDQSYFLWDIPAEVLLHTVFPVGDLPKREVRAIARRIGLPNADKKDSQGVCFVGQLDFARFLRGRITPVAGQIRHADGRLLGCHDGAAFYTVGQRHGLDIKDGGGPYFVIDTNVRTNIVTVGRAEELGTRVLNVPALRWIHGVRPSGRLSVQIRYRSAPIAITAIRGNVISLAGDVRAAAPGQAAVIYHGQRVVGGGVLR